MGGMDQKKKIEALKKLFAALPEERLLAAIRGVIALDDYPSAAKPASRPSQSAHHKSDGGV